MKNISDEQLVKYYLNGNEKALEEIIWRYLPLIYSFSRRYDGDLDNVSDITQEIFVKVWKNLKKFDPDENFKTWIFTIAKNTALDWLKKKKSLPLSLLVRETIKSSELKIDNYITVIGSPTSNGKIEAKFIRIFSFPGLFPMMNSK